MKPENFESKQTMEKAELDLWKELAVYSLRGRLGLIRSLYPGVLVDAIEEDNNKDAEEALDGMEKLCTALIDDINKIDVTHFDNRFPLGLIKTLTEKGPSALNEVLELARTLFKHKDITSDLRKDTMEKTAFLIELSDQLATNPKYIEYRNLTEHIA